MPAKPEPSAPAPTELSELTDFERAVAEVLTSSVPGDVMTYGEIAAEAGFPGASRAVGSFLKRHEGYPWWRVVNAAGRLAPGNEAEQQRRLRAEGIQVSGGRVRFQAPPRLP